MRARVIAAALLALTSTAAPAQTAAPLGDARIAHLAVAVPDIDRALQMFADVLGVDPVKANAITVDAPDGRKVPMKIANIGLSNFLLELDQPNGGAGPAQEFLEKYGPGIQHLGIGVTGPLDPRVKALVDRGGRWTLGAPGGRYAFVDLMPTLGMTIDFSQGASSPAPAAPAKGVHPGGLASYPVSQIIVVTPDAQATAKAMAAVFGDAPSPTQIVKSLSYPPGSNANPSAQLKTIKLRHGGVTLEIVEPVGGPSPAADFLARRKGPGAFSLAFDVGDKLDDMVRALQAKGGKWTLGRAGGGYAWVDFTDSLGLVIELRGPR